MSPWFKREQESLTAGQKKNIPDGIWMKCDSCGEILYRRELIPLAMVCPKCGNHFRISSQDYIELLLDPENRHEWDAGLKAADPLEFSDTIKYADRAVQHAKKSGMNEAVRSVTGSIGGFPVELEVMDFSFMGGSVGAVVGEKMSRAITRACKRKAGLVIISCSGGMRMQEGVFSLMQMAKVSAALVRLSREKLPFISILTNPTTGGTTASFAMLGDVNISEPKALIGFAGPRVIKQTIGQDLPEGFQSAEFLLEKGFLDMVVVRSELRGKLITLLGHFMADTIAKTAD